MKKNYLSKLLITLFATFAITGCSLISDIIPNNPPEEPAEPEPDPDPQPEDPPVVDDTVAVTGVTLDRHSADLKVGDAISLDATISPSNATNKQVNWTISDNTVVSFENNVVVALKVGEATITATTVDGGFQDHCDITVTAKGEANPEVVHVSSITLSDKSVSLEVGETKALTAEVLPANATNKNYIWSTSDASIASVSGGVITANKKGNATITVTTEDGGLTDTCAVTVTKTEEPPEETPDEHIVNNQYLLNEYGDYFEYVDSSKDAKGLTEEYENLTKEKKYSSNGILEAKYQVGLYEFFNIENKVDLKINISSTELNKLDNDFYTGNKETYRICDLDISYLGLHFHFEEVGIRQKGNTSRGAILSGDRINLRHYKLSFEETFDDEYTDTPKTWTSKDAKDVREDRKSLVL